jgi:hypothetical protein
MSLSSYRYYIIFIDVFSRSSWLYPLHTKVDVFVSLVKFKTLVDNQFSTRINCNMMVVLNSFPMSLNIFLN